MRPSASLRLPRPFALLFLAIVALGLGSPSRLRAQPAAPDPAPPPVTGPALAGLEGADAVMLGLMKKFAVPGAQLAVAHHGRLVLAHGYGFADRDAALLVQPTSRFRLASLSKLLTAVAILTLAEEGKLDLDAPAFALLPNLTPLPGATPDPRLARITVRQLLQHTGGWDRGASGDPMFQPLVIANATHTPAPADAIAIIRYQLGRPLDFDPGAKYAYSNFGYNVLGRIVEKLSGRPYGAFVRARVLAPAGAASFALGRTLLADRAPDEVRYYDFPGTGPVAAVFPSVKSRVPSPYGGFNLEAMDAHGAWISTAVDYVRLVCALDGSRPPALLKPASLAALTARPAAPVSDDAAAYYGFGLQIRPGRAGAGLGANWWHSGSLPGTITYQVRLASGWTWAAFFNTRPKESNALTSEVDRAINAALAAAHPPPEGDLFTQFSVAPSPKN